MYTNYFKLFNLKENYTMDDLKKSFNSKISIIENMSINDVDRQILMDKYIYEYKLAKKNLNNKNKSNYNNFSSVENELINPFFGFDNMNFIENNLKKLLNNNFSEQQFMNSSNGNTFNSSYGKSYMMSSITNPDGTTTVLEKDNLYNNGKTDSKTFSYKLDKNGNKIPVEYDEAMNEFKSRKYLN